MFIHGKNPTFLSLQRQLTHTRKYRGTDKRRYYNDYKDNRDNQDMPLFALRKPQNDVLSVVRCIPLQRRSPERIDAFQIAQVERCVLK
jgi:hypothetical protein